MTPEQKAAKLAHTQKMITVLRGLLEGTPNFRQAGMAGAQYTGWTPAQLRKELAHYENEEQALTAPAGKSRLKRVLLTP